MKDNVSDLVRYTYNCGAIKSFKLVKRNIHEYHDIDRLEHTVSEMIYDINNEMKTYEDKYGVERP